MLWFFFGGGSTYRKHNLPNTEKCIQALDSWRTSIEVCATNLSGTQSRLDEERRKRNNDEQSRDYDAHTSLLANTNNDAIQQLPQIQTIESDGAITLFEQWMFLLFCTVVNESIYYKNESIHNVDVELHRTQQGVSSVHRWIVHQAICVYNKVGNEHHHATHRPCE